ncbi:DUF1906 domain-containing protein [Dactylosporangium sp. CA-139066]|uniref:DUF1906 domain-containing protein n=1 Tax=Dactylosporangium sp. CA-139066 TaxID=3239930 RepID=UPI003D8BFAD5
MAEGVDYAWDRPNLDQLWNAGKRFVCRYLAYLPNGKVLSDSERRSLHAKGFSIVLNWEQAAGDMFKGYATGQAHAREALRQANAVGAPASVPIYFSCDKDVTTAAQMNAVADYLDGAASVLGRSRVGVYGEYSVIEAMVPNHAAWGWQTYAWSGGKTSAKAHFKQYRNGVQLAGADLDLNVSLKSNIGAWLPPSVEHVTEEEDMNLTDVVTLPADAYPEAGSSATVGVILGYTNGRMVRVEGAVAAIKAQVADMAAKVDALSVPAPAPVTVDADALRAVLTEPAFLAALAKAVNDDAARRMES